MKRVLLATALMVAVWVSRLWPGVGQGRDPVLTAQTKVLFDKQADGIRAQIGQGGRYQFIKDDEKRTVEQRLNSIAAILDKHADGSRINDAEKLQIVNAQKKSTPSWRSATASAWCASVAPHRVAPPGQYLPHLWRDRAGAPRHPGSAAPDQCREVDRARRLRPLRVTACADLPPPQGSDTCCTLGRPDKTRSAGGAPGARPAGRPDRPHFRPPARSGIVPLPYPVGCRHERPQIARTPRSLRRPNWPSSACCGSAAPRPCATCTNCSTATTAAATPLR